MSLQDTLSDQLRALHDKWGMNLERFNGDRSWTLPLPGRFVPDRHGTIIHVDVHPDCTGRPEPTEIVGIRNTIDAPAVHPVAHGEKQ